MLVYLALVVVPVVLVVFALRFGADLLPDTATPTPAEGGRPDPTPGRPEEETAPDPYRKLLFALPLVYAACHVVAWLCRRIGQPPVIGEIVAGILLGPSLLGWLWPTAFDWLFPPYLLPVLNVLGQLGLLAFMFLVGHELDLAHIRGRGAAALAISHVSIALPLLCGVLLAFGMFGTFAPHGVPFFAFALFLGVSMSITAFPVLARILTDRGLYDTPLGALALTCAAICDVTAWCLLAVVVATTDGGSLSHVAWTLALSVAFTALMLLVVRPALARLLAARALPAGAVLPVLFGGAALSALATELIGVHAIFGAFLFGVITPRGTVEGGRAAGHLQAVTVPLLLPLFFVHIGLLTRFELLGGDAGLWLWCLAAIAVATVGKWGGTTVVARTQGLGRRESLALGSLMNCRGLTELIVLGIGLELGVITPTLFTILVITALVTTALTSPALAVLVRTPGDTGAVTPRPPAGAGCPAPGSERERGTP
ncbi:cation:proton antiporter [Allostreptomyces psammosilenae]|uniref:Kef-type K+ transport system membrane component KefB n=1 Tax=Allostreptomyces psammosilenae TaxID=1892865 RepID=A0A853A6B8_9ACTN|nr:cation:proton antiporter [Allostreptomyces psammosilenae]NYI06022.1 Kef-type K+ transport system membrane component KefB [Allostreptomyces psammosilenae]